MKLRYEYGKIVNHKKVARIKKEYGLKTITRKRRASRYGLDNMYEHARKKNLLNRNFNAKKINATYCTDITVIQYGRNQKAYLSALKDICSREIVSYKVSPYADLSLSTEVVQEALIKLSPTQRKQLMIHSDQGTHYTSIFYQNILNENGVQQSMSRRGNCLDNAPIESFFGHLKDEVDFLKMNSFEEVKNKVKRYMNYYNNDRRQWTLKKMSPIEFKGHLTSCSGF